MGAANSLVRTTVIPTGTATANSRRRPGFRGRSVRSSLAGRMSCPPSVFIPAGIQPAVAGCCKDYPRDAGRRPGFAASQCRCDRDNLSPNRQEGTMRGVVFTGGRELEMMEFPDPTPGPDEVVVEMKASGMCGSDLHQYRRPKTSGGANATGLPANPNPVIAGHEPCGVVAAVGPGVIGQGSEGRRTGDGAPLPGLHAVQSLPLRLAAALPGSAGEGVRQQLAWRTREVSEGAGQHAGAAGGRASLLRRRGDLVRLRHGVQRAAADAALRQRHDRDLRPGAGRPGRHAVRQGDGCAGDRARRQPAAAAARQGLRRGRGGGSRLERSGGGDQGPDARTLRRSVAGHVEQSGSAGERDPQHQGMGHDVLRRRGRRREDRCQPACCCAGR